MDITTEMKNLLLSFNKYRFKTVLEERTDSFMLGVEIFGITSLEISQGTHDPHIISLLKKEVKMVWHKAKADNLY